MGNPHQNEIIFPQPAKIKLTGNEVSHVDQVFGGPISSGSSFGRLDKAVDSFKESVGKPAVEPGQDSVPMIFDGFGDFSDLLNLTADAPGGGGEVPEPRRVGATERK
jgi:hypothetical protein